MNKIKKLLAILPLFFLILGGNVQAQQQSTSTLETDELLKLVNLKTVDGRKVAEVPLQLVLQLALEQSILLQSSKLGNALERITKNLKNKSLGYFIRWKI